MKRLALAGLLALTLAPAGVLAYTSPGKPAGYVSDFAGILSPAVEASIAAKLSDYEASTGNEIAVVTVASLGGEAIEPYATELFEEWGIGKADEDNGALLLVAPNDREARIEVGYGLEPYLTDAASSRIMRETLIPAFQRGEYEAGIEAGADRMLASLTGAEDLTDERAEGSGASSFAESVLPFLFVALIQLVPVIIYSKSWWLGGVVGAVFGFLLTASVLAALGFAAFGLVADYLLSRVFGGKGKGPGGRGTPGVWFGGLGGMGGRGGGSSFGGFGGGFSGGGGASGRW